MECRIYAEDPQNHFFPSPGQIISWRPPHGPGIRLDEGVYPGWKVPGDYDPLLAKLIAWGPGRAEAVARLERALDEFEIAGIRTNTVLFKKILAAPDFQNGAIHTRWLDEHLNSLCPAHAPEVASASESLEIKVAMVAAALWHVSQSKSTNEHSVQPVSRWRDDARREQISRTPNR
jgi:acetyl-CoA carboxylase biotin carboxylase subunit